MCYSFNRLRRERKEHGLDTISPKVWAITPVPASLRFPHTQAICLANRLPGGDRCQAPAPHAVSSERKFCFLTWYHPSLRGWFIVAVFVYIMDILLPIDTSHAPCKV